MVKNTWMHRQTSGQCAEACGTWGPNCTPVLNRGRLLFWKFPVCSWKFRLMTKIRGQVTWWCMMGQFTWLCRCFFFLFYMCISEWSLWFYYASFVNKGFPCCHRYKHIDTTSALFILSKNEDYFLLHEMQNIYERKITSELLCFIKLPQTSPKKHKHKTFPVLWMGYYTVQYGSSIFASMWQLRVYICEFCWYCRMW